MWPTNSPTEEWSEGSGQIRDVRLIHNSIEYSLTVWYNKKLLSYTYSKLLPSVMSMFRLSGWLRGLYFAGTYIIAANFAFKRNYDSKYQTPKKNHKRSHLEIIGCKWRSIIFCYQCLVAFSQYHAMNLIQINIFWKRGIVLHLTTFDYFMSSKIQKYVQKTFCQQPKQLRLLPW